MLSKKLVIIALSFVAIASCATPAFTALQSDLGYKFKTENKDEFYNTCEIYLNFDGAIPDFLLDIYDFTPQTLYNSEYGVNIVLPVQRIQTPLKNAPHNVLVGSYQTAPAVTTGAPQGTDTAGYTGANDGSTTNSATGMARTGQTANVLPCDNNLNVASYPTCQNDADTPPQYPLTSIEQVRNRDGSIGNLEIPKIGLTVTAYDGDTYAVMKKGIGHISSTSAWLGNCGFVGHNRGTNDYFGKIKNLVVDDEMTYTTKLGTKTYVVQEVCRISETDRSKLQYTSDNRLTLLTCVEDVPSQRLCVTAVEKQ